MKSSTKTQYVITNEDRTEFFKSGMLSTDDVHTADLFCSQTVAKMWFRQLTTFQARILTEIVPVRTTIVIEPEKQHSYYKDGNLYTPIV